MKYKFSKIRSTPCVLAVIADTSALVVSAIAKDHFLNVDDQSVKKQSTLQVAAFASASSDYSPGQFYQQGGDALFSDKPAMF
jgi:hypothetical protein